MSERKTQRVWKGQQSWNYRAIWTVRDKKVRITIKVDSYAFQSYGRAEILNETKDQWHSIASIPGEQSATYQKIGAYDRDITAAAFEEDERQLIAEIDLILS